MRLLITGISGLLGNNLAFYFRNSCHVSGWYYTRPIAMEGICTQHCQICDPEQVDRAIEAINPDVIIHCASLTNVDQCESNQELAKLVNADGTRNIVKAANSQKNVKIIYISTDSVYSGEKDTNTETDKINPQNFYGWSKYQGEQEISNSERSLILRTNLFGWNIVNDKKSLAEWIIAEIQSGRCIHGFTDAMFSSIYTMELARVIEIALHQDLKGVYNCGSSTACSKYEFAQELVKWFGLDTRLIEPASIETAGLKAKRGKNLSLDSSNLEKAINYQLPSINYSIERFYRDFKAGLPQKIKQADTIYPKKDTFIQYGRQSIDHSDIEAVVRVIKSGRMTQGPEINAFEKELAYYCDAKFAVAVNSGTSALHIACLAADLGPGDEVITSTNTFVASANCAVYCGATPVLADIDPLTYSIGAKEIKKKLSPKTKAVIPVHFAGQPCRMDAIKKVVMESEARFGHKIHIIEDGSHALGSSYQNAKVGSCPHSDMTVFSFHPVKHVTTGEGGAVLTNAPEFSEKLKMLRSHGITSMPSRLIYQNQAIADPGAPEIERYNPWYYEQQYLGLNYRITDFQSALGRSQLQKIEAFRKRRQTIIANYNNRFSKIEFITTPYQDEDCDSNLHLYVVLIDFDKLDMGRAQLMYALRRRGIQTQVHYIPVHTQPFYQKFYRTRWGDCPQAETYYRSCLSLPLFPAMDESEVARVIQAMKDLIKKGPCF